MENWFNEQSPLVQVILLFIPFIGWIIEILVRVFALIRLQSKTNIIGLVVFFIIGGFWLPCIIDAIYLSHKETLIALE